MREEGQRNPKTDRVFVCMCVCVSLFVTVKGDTCLLGQNSIDIWCYSIAKSDTLFKCV